MRIQTRLRRRTLSTECLEPRCLLTSVALLGELPPETTGPVAALAEESPTDLRESLFSTPLGLDVVLHAGPNLTANQPALDAFRRAAVVWESLIDDPVTIHFDVEISTEGIEGNNILGLSSSQTVEFFYSDVRQRLIADATPDEAIVASLPELGGDLTFDLASGISLNERIVGDPVIRLTRANAQALGFSNLPGRSSKFDLGVVVDASIKFNADFSFDFDSSDGVTFGQADFEAVAIHEIGHALGFTSSVDIVDSLVHDQQSATVNPSILDLFRIGAGEGDQFATTPRILNTGDNVAIQVFHDGQFDVSAFSQSIPQLRLGDIPFSTGVELGDGKQASHFKDDALSGVDLGLLDPTLPLGSIGELSPLDLRILGLIGWDIPDRGLLGTTPTVTVEPITTLNTSPQLTGSVSEADARVFVRLPASSALNRAMLLVDGDPSSNGDFVLFNSPESSGKITRVELVLPGEGVFFGVSSATPFFDTTGGQFGDSSRDFVANVQDLIAVGLSSPQSDNLNDADVTDGSKTLTLTFDDFDPGEVISWKLDIDQRGRTGIDLIGGHIFVYFDNGLAIEGILGPVSGNSDESRAVVQSDRFYEAQVSDGVWTLPTDTLEALAPGIHSVDVIAVDSSGAIGRDASSGEIFIRTPGILSLGDQVFLDTNGDGVFDPVSGERGIADVSISLYDDTDGNGVFSPGVDRFLQSVLTRADGRYGFESLAPGSYIVQIDPENFLAGQPLESLESSNLGQDAPDPNDDVNGDDNGNLLEPYGVVSAAVDLAEDSEPVDDGDESANSNRSVDFGFVPPQVIDADLNDDDRVDRRDIVILLGVFGTVFDSTDQIGDLNGDSRADLHDLALTQASLSGPILPMSPAAADALFAQPSFVQPLYAQPLYTQPLYTQPSNLPPEPAHKTTARRIRSNPRVDPEQSPSRASRLSAFAERSHRRQPFSVHQRSV